MFGELPYVFHNCTESAAAVVPDSPFVVCFLQTVKCNLYGVQRVFLEQFQIGLFEQGAVGDHRMVNQPYVFQLICP